MTIRVKIYHDDEEIGRLVFEKLDTDSQGRSDYKIEIGIERMGSADAVGLYTRKINDVSPRANALALVRAALFQLEGQELLLDDGTSTPDLVGRQRSFSREIQGWAGGLHNNGPAFRRG